MKFARIEKTSLSDYPGKICSLLYTVGCNFRCPFCYNAPLVIPEKYPKELLDEDEVFNILLERKTLVDAVAITGGEPTLHPDLLDFLRKLKDAGFSVKLDTNGTNPDMVETMINEKVVDYFAIDVKTAKDEYSKAVGIPNPPVDKIETTLKRIVESGIPHDFRTTIVPGIHTVESMKKIGEWLNQIGETERYVIQTFFMPDGVEFVKPDFNPGLFKKEEIQLLVNTVKPYFKTVEVRDYIYMEKY